MLIYFKEVFQNLNIFQWKFAISNKYIIVFRNKFKKDNNKSNFFQIDAEPLKEREAELYSIISYANMHGLKQIKGIEDRLYGLDQLLSEVKKIERDQRDQAASLIQVR